MQLNRLQERTLNLKYLPGYDGITTDSSEIKILRECIIILRQYLEDRKNRSWDLKIIQIPKRTLWKDDLYETEIGGIIKDLKQALEKDDREIDKTTLEELDSIKTKIDHALEVLPPSSLYKPHTRKSEYGWMANIALEACKSIIDYTIKCICKAKPELDKRRGSDNCIIS